MSFFFYLSCNVYDLRLHVRPLSLKVLFSRPRFLVELPPLRPQIGNRQPFVPVWANGAQTSPRTPPSAENFPGRSDKGSRWFINNGDRVNVTFSFEGWECSWCVFNFWQTNTAGLHQMRLLHLTHRITDYDVIWWLFTLKKGHIRRSKITRDIRSFYGRTYGRTDGRTDMTSYRDA